MGGFLGGITWFQRRGDQLALTECLPMRGNHLDTKSALRLLHSTCTKQKSQEYILILLFSGN